MGRKKLNRERFNITMPAGLGDELLRVANEEGRDRSDLLTELAKAFLRKREAREAKRKPRGKKKRLGESGW